MRSYKFELVCPGCDEKNVVERRSLSYVQFKPVIYTCSMCESKVFMSVRRRPHESNRQLEMRLVRFQPSEAFVAALKEQVEEEAKGDQNETSNT